MKSSVQSGLYLQIEKEDGLDSCNSIRIHHSTKNDINLARTVHLENDQPDLLSCVFPFKKPEYLAPNQDITVVFGEEDIAGVSAGYAWGNTFKLGMLATQEDWGNSMM